MEIFPYQYYQSLYISYLGSVARMLVENRSLDEIDSDKELLPIPEMLSECPGHSDSGS